MLRELRLQAGNASGRCAQKPRELLMCQQWMSRDKREYLIRLPRQTSVLVGFTEEGGSASEHLSVQGLLGRLMGDLLQKQLPGLHTRACAQRIVCGHHQEWFLAFALRSRPAQFDQSAHDVPIAKNRCRPDIR
jgi:hypothetical protein